MGAPSACSCLLLTHSHHSSSTSVCSGSGRCPRLILHSTGPSPRIVHFSKEPWLHLVHQRFLQLRETEIKHVQESSLFLSKCYFSQYLNFPVVFLSTYYILDVEDTEMSEIRNLLSSCSQPSGRDRPVNR